MSASKQVGFTFIEMLAVVAVIALLSAMAVPGMRELLRNSRISSMNDDLQSSLALARSTAVTQRRMVIWVRTTAPDGWEVRRDSATGPLLAEHRIASNAADMTIYPAATPTTPLTEIRFEPTGLVKRNDSGVATDVEFRICSPDVTTEVGRSVRVSRLGRLVSGKHADATVCNP